MNDTRDKDGPSPAGGTVAPPEDAPWRNPEPGRLVGRGHPIGDLLEAHEWRVLEERNGYLLLD